MTRPRPLVLAVLLALAVALATSGCSAGLGGTDDKGYLDGNGVIRILGAGKRVTPGPISGTTLDGDTVSLSRGVLTIESPGHAKKVLTGKIVVVNVWGSWCPPCRAEADDLEKASQQLASRGVVFLGINTRDNSADTARAFLSAQGVGYDSIFDPGGTNLLAFHRTLSPNAIPSTVVIDGHGQVAASILGEVTSAQTLVDLVDEVSK